MAGIPQAGRNALIDRQFGVSPSATVYAALVTVIGTDTAAGTEVTGGGYARQAMAFDTAAAGVTENTGLVSWTASGASYGTVVGVEIWSAATGGTRLYWAPLDTNRTVNDTDTLEIAAGAVTYTWSA